MANRRIAAVVGLTFALVGCGADSNDAVVGWSDASSGSTTSEDGPQIVVMAVDAESTDDAADTADTADGVDGVESLDEAVPELMAVDSDAAVEGPSEEGSTLDGESGDHAADHDTDTDVDGESGDHAADHDTDTDVDGESGGQAADAESDHDAVTRPPDELAVAQSGVVVGVEMNDFGYVLDRTSVPVGEPVTFRFVNVGLIEHEAMFGSLHQQEEFAAADDHGDHGEAGHHGDVAAITLDANLSGELVVVFDSPGELMIGCHLPGHWDAGMWTTFEVVAA